MPRKKHISAHEIGLLPPGEEVVVTTQTGERMAVRDVRWAREDVILVLDAGELRVAGSFVFERA